MHKELESIISELGSHDPGIDWELMPSRIDAAIEEAIGEITNTDPVSINRLRCIRGALLDFIAVCGCENREGFLLDVARIELLKLGWV